MIDPLVSQSASTGTSVTRTAPSVDYDSFLKLLIATMKNQDPTAPNDPAQTLSQLASFSTVEQGLKTNALLERILSGADASQASTLMGREVSNASGSVQGRVEHLSMSESGWMASLSGGAVIAVSDIVRIA